jgi:hypothetical protein
MNFERFRRTGELSDITIVVNKTEFKLHTFPLFTASDYFKELVGSLSRPAPPVIELDASFPGDEHTFSQLVDHLYSLPIVLDSNNLVPLRLAGAFTRCSSLVTLIDEHVDSLLLVARTKQDVTQPLRLLERCASSKYRALTNKIPLVDKCLRFIVDSLTFVVRPSLSKADRLPFDWIIRLIELCSTGVDSQRAILPFVKHYINVRILDETSPAGHASTDARSGRSTDSDDEKRVFLDRIVELLANRFEQYPLVWLNSLHEQAVHLKCQCQSNLSSYITQAVLNSSDLDPTVGKLPDDVMAQLFERIHKHNDEHVRDPRLLAKVLSLRAVCRLVGNVRSLI